LELAFQLGDAFCLGRGEPIKAKDAPGSVR